MAARFPGHYLLHAAYLALTDVDLSGIGEELASFWVEVQYRAIDYWAATEHVQAWVFSGEGDGDEPAVVRQRLAWIACRDLLRGCPRKPDTGTGSPAVVVYWQALSLLSRIHTNEGQTVPTNVWNGMGPGPGDGHYPEADDRV
jgi:hypothetical protein